MATSTFSKEFKVKSKKAREFANEMSRKVIPTLRKDFKSNLKYEEELRDALKKAIK